MIATDLMEKNNSAGRLLRLFNDTHSKQQNVQARSIWPEVLGLSVSLPEHDLTAELATMLTPVDDELKQIRVALLSKGIPDGLVSPYVDKARNAVTATLLTAPWSNVTQYFTADTLLAFQWFAFELNEEIQAISQEDVAKLLEEMASLEAELQTAGLSSGLKEFLLSHLRQMQTALRQSRIAGTKPLQKAVRTTQHECELEAEHISAEVQVTNDKTAAKKVIERFITVWKGAVKLAGDTEKLEKGAKAIGGTVTTLLEYFSKN